MERTPIELVIMFLVMIVIGYYLPVLIKFLTELGIKGWDYSIFEGRHYHWQLGTVSSVLLVLITAILLLTMSPISSGAFASILGALVGSGIRLILLICDYIKLYKNRKD